MSRFKVRWEEKIANIIKQEQDAIKTWDAEKAKNPLANARVVGGLEYPPNSSRFPMMRVKKYEISYQGKQIYRSYKDFIILRSTLMENFPGAFIQPLPKIRSKSAMSLFFNSVVFNPFFSSDETVEKFLDSRLDSFSAEMRLYKKQKKNGKVRLSLGIKAWMHYLSIHGNGVGEDFESQKAFFDSLRADLIMFGRSIKTLQAKVKSLMSMQEGQALFNSELSGVLQAVMSTELNSKSLSQTVETKSAAARLTEAARRTAKAFHEHTNLLTKEYGAPTIQKKLIDPLEQQMKIVSFWISLISTTESEIKLFHANEAKIDSEKNANSKKKLVRKQAEIEKRLSIKFCGLFGMELERYKIYRENSMELILRELSNFHCVGALRLFDIWKLHDPHRINLDRYDYSECFANNREIQKKEKQIMKNMSEQGEFELFSLVVNRDAKVRRIPGRKALPLKPGAYLVGRKVHHPKTKELLWYATDTNGRRGYIETRNVTEDKCLPIDPNASRRLQTQSIISGEDSSNHDSSRLTLDTHVEESVSSLPPPVPTFKPLEASEKSVIKLSPPVKIPEVKEEKVEEKSTPSLPIPTKNAAFPAWEAPTLKPPLTPEIKVTPKQPSLPRQPVSVSRNHQIAAIGKLSEVKAKSQPLADLDNRPQMPKMNMGLLAAINNAKKDNVLKPAVKVENRPPPKPTTFVNPLMAEMQKKLLSRRQHIKHDEEDDDDDEKFL